MPQADIFATPNMLNATLPLKQDAESQKKITQFGTDFKSKWSDQVWKVLKDSNMVHYARFTVIDDIQAPHAHKWMQILTEFDGDFITYSEFFAEKLPEFFRTVFSLLDAPEPKTATGELDLAKIFEYIDARNLKCVGGVAFSAIGPFEVSEVKKKLGVTD